MKFNLILIRHGQSEANVNPELYNTNSNTTVGLTQRGREQSEELALTLSKEYLNSENNKILYSPWSRAEQTASIISSKLPHKTFQQELYIYEIAENSQESYQSVYKRAEIFYQKLKSNKYNFKNNDNIFIVSHAVFLLMLRAVILNIPENEIMKNDWLGNCETWKFNLESD